jgi:hypothetical protein
MEQMVEVGTKHCPKEQGVDEMLGLVELQRKTLAKEVEKYCRERSE